VPWCDSCSAYRAPTALTNGTCPSCGGAVENDISTSDEAPVVGRSAPWHFWLVVVLLAGYLLWRLVGFIIWIVT